MVTLISSQKSPTPNISVPSVSHFGVGRHGSFPQKPVVKSFLTCKFHNNNHQCIHYSQYTLRLWSYKSKHDYCIHKVHNLENSNIQAYIRHICGRRNLDCIYMHHFVRHRRHLVLQCCDSCRLEVKTFCLFCF